MIVFTFLSFFAIILLFVTAKYFFAIFVFAVKDFKRGNQLVHVVSVACQLGYWVVFQIKIS
jgi:hypothetical protein